MDYKNTTMATRLIEPLNISRKEGIKDWIAILESGIKILQIPIMEQFGTEPERRKKEIDQFWVHCLLSHIGSEGYKVLKSYCAPEEPAKTAYQDLTKILREKLAPTPTEVSEQYRFAQIRQETTESLSMFMARIKTAAADCGFRDFYDTMVRNRFICGLREEKLEQFYYQKKT